MDNIIKLQSSLDWSIVLAYNKDKSVVQEFTMDTDMRKLLWGNFKKKYFKYKINKWFLEIWNEIHFNEVNF